MTKIKIVAEGALNDILYLCVELSMIVSEFSIQFSLYQWLKRH
jgi:hypothetical protein